MQLILPPFHHSLTYPPTHRSVNPARATQPITRPLDWPKQSLLPSPSPQLATLDESHYHERRAPVRNEISAIDDALCSSVDRAELEATCWDFLEAAKKKKSQNAFGGSHYECLVFFWKKAMKGGEKLKLFPVQLIGWLFNLISIGGGGDDDDAQWFLQKFITGGGCCPEPAGVQLPPTGLMMTFFFFAFPWQNRHDMFADEMFTHSQWSLSYQGV